MSSGSDNGCLFFEVPEQVIAVFGWQQLAYQEGDKYRSLFPNSRCQACWLGHACLQLLVWLDRSRGSVSRANRAWPDPGN